MCILVFLPLISWLVSSLSLGYHEAERRQGSCNGGAGITPWGCEWRDTDYVGNEGTAVYSDKELSSSRRLFMGRRLEDAEKVDWLVGLKNSILEDAVDTLIGRLVDNKVSTAESATGKV